MTRCLLCQRAITERPTLNVLLSLGRFYSTYLCDSCRQTFVSTPKAIACPGCGRPNAGQLCRDCKRWARIEPLLINHALFQYNDAMKRYLFQYKGMGDYRLNRAFWDVVVTIDPHTRFVPIPTDPRHFASRGFDPNLGLFAPLHLTNWLAKAPLVAPQAQKDRQQRLATPQTFTFIGDEEQLNATRRITLLDDVYTTGRTIRHARNALLSAGYKGRVDSVTLAR